MLFTPMTKSAMKLAYEAHQGQVDRSGIPYILHPARVAENFTSEPEACVAWLHDVIEDTKYTLQDIRLAGFGKRPSRSFQKSNKPTFLSFARLGKWNRS